jgi:chromate transporter
LSKLNFLKQVFIISLTAFGGPHAHLHLFIQRFTQKNKVLSKEQLLNYHSLCSIVPGATSTQLLCLIAYKAGGLILMSLTFLMWVLPSCSIMFGLSMLLQENDAISYTETVFFFFQPMVIGFMLYSASITKPFFYEHNKDKLLLTLNVIILLLLHKHPFIIPIAFLLNAIIAHYIRGGSLPNIDKQKLLSLSLNRKYLLIFFTLLVTSAFLSEYSRKTESSNRYYFNLLEHNYRHGSIIYGGGDVLIPIMYEQYVSRPTAEYIKRRNPDVLSLRKQELIAGATFIRLMPGPVFSIISFTTPFLVRDYSFNHKLLATAIATVSIFVPGLLIILILLPLWNRLTQNKTFNNYLKGFNLTVLAIILSSGIYLMIDLFGSSDTIYMPVTQFLVIIMVYHALKNLHINHSYIAICCMIGGLILHFL